MAAFSTDSIHLKKPSGGPKGLIGPPCHGAMRNFHSLLLKPMPTGAKPRRSRIPRRLLLVASISTFIVIPAFIMISRLLPRQGAGYIFYWIHDHIFLPLKGYTYTLFYPYSLSWWGPILTALLFWLIAYLTMVSFIKDPHAWVLRKVVCRTKRHPVLVKTSRWLKKWRMEPVLLKEVTHLERERALHQLLGVPLSQPAETPVSRVVYLTRLHIDLMTLPPVKKAQETYLEALCYWHRAYMQTRVRFQMNPQAEHLKTLTAQLAEQAEMLILPLLNYRDETQLKEAIAQRVGFDVTSTAVDLLYLAALYNNNLAFFLLGPTAAAGGEAIQKAVSSRLAASVSERRAILEEIRTRLEKLPDQTPAPFAAHKSETFAPVLEGNIGIDANAKQNTLRATLPVIARLSLSLALDLAALVDMVSIGLGYMDALEAYDFVFNGLELETVEELESLYFTVLRSLNQLPEPGEYRLAAELAEIQLNRYENLWKQSILKDDGTITPGDFQLARTRVQSLYHAAGPGLDES